MRDNSNDGERIGSRCPSGNIAGGFDGIFNNKYIKIMKELVFKGDNNRIFTNSLLVAEKFNKQHKHVIESIKRIIDSADISAQYFVSTTYVDSSGKSNIMYVMNRDGFTLLTMGFTGDKALQFKLDYIEAFNRMEEQIKTGDFQIPQSFSEALMLAAKQQEQIEQANRTISKLQPKADFADKAFETSDKVDIGMAAKILKLGFGRNILFKKLKEMGVFFSNRNEPKQKYINAGYFEMTEKFIERENHPGFVVTKVLVTQKGLAYINHLLGGDPGDGKITRIV
nr:MAG: antirepressor protein KilAC domain [Bacteriophage sp.]